MQSQPAAVRREAAPIQYDFNSAEGIRAIPGTAELLRLAGRDDLAVDCCLRQKSIEHEKADNIELALLCLRKSNEIRLSSPRGYMVDD